MTLEEVADHYRRLENEAAALLVDLREGRCSVKVGKQRCDVLSLSYELLTLEQEILRRIEGSTVPAAAQARRRGGKRT